MIYRGFSTNCIRKGCLFLGKEFGKFGSDTILKLFKSTWKSWKNQRKEACLWRNWDRRSRPARFLLETRFILAIWKVSGAPSSPRDWLLFQSAICQIVWPEKCTGCSRYVQWSCYSILWSKEIPVYVFWQIADRDIVAIRAFMNMSFISTLDLENIDHTKMKAKSP